MSHLKAVHWLAPTTIIFTLLLGTLLALGHHIFYAKLDRKSVPVGSYAFAGKQLPRQQFNTSVGIALAFLVKMFLSLALSTIYVQFFWRSIKDMKQRPTIAELDWAYSGIENILYLFNLKIGWKYPFLVFIALIFWCIPIATIFPPATLSVENAREILTSMLQVPQFDFATLNYAAPLYSGEDTSERIPYAWNGPSRSVQHIALAVMGLGQILPVSSPASNATWTLDFWGPALQCNDVAKTERHETWISIWNSYNETRIGPYAFLSWVPWSYINGDLDGIADDTYRQHDLHAVNTNLPFIFNYTSDSPVVGPPVSSLPMNGSASFFIATFPEAPSVTLMPPENSTMDNSPIIYNVNTDNRCYHRMMHEITDPGTAHCFGGQMTAAQFYVNSTLLRCDLVNTSYSVDFNYSAGAQDIHISSNMTGISKIINSTDSFIGPEPGNGSSSGIPLPANCSLFSSLEDWESEPCVFDLDDIRQLSYQGIMAAFTEFVLGSIQTGDGSLNGNTSVVRTVLAAAKELAYLRNGSDIYDESLQTVISNSTGWAYPGLVNTNPIDTNADLKSTVERLFQNFTISLLAEPYFQPNYSSPFAPQRLTNVSLLTYHNIYTYDRETLWIAYGLSIFFTTLAAIAGIIAVLLNGASYSNNFSTIVRVARTADLSTEILDKERDGFGQDPLPKYLKHARLNMNGRADGVAAAAASGANTDVDRLMELVERRPVEVDEESSIATREMDQSHDIDSAEGAQSPVVSRRSIESRSSIVTREMDLSHRDISAEEQQSFFISRRSIESVE